jgi:hypothetical protein
MAKLPELSKRMEPTMAEATRPTEEEIRSVTDEVAN